MNDEIQRLAPRVVIDKRVPRTTSRLVSRHRFALRACAVALAALLGVAGAASAKAENLMDVYRQALRQDPVLKQAAAVSREGRAGVGISRAPLLPNLSASAELDANHGTQTGSQFVDTSNGLDLSNTGVGSGERSRSYSVGLSQVLFDLGDISQWRASQSTAKADEAAFVSAQQDLILRVATAYFQVLSDDSQLKYAESNAASLKKQLDQSQAEFDVGLVAITTVADSRAAHDAAVSTVISDKNIVFTDRQALSQITGQQPGTLETLTPRLPLQPPAPNNMDDWVKTALASNPALEAERDQLEAAQHSLGVARAQRLPTLNASVQYSRNASWSGSNIANTSGLPSNLQQELNFDSRGSSTAIGLVLTVPLFSGGGTEAEIQQAVAERDQTNQVLVQDHRTTVANARNAFNAIETGISSVEANKEAVKSAKVALDSTQAGFQVGTESIVDLLSAQSTYFDAQSAYSLARHTLVINRLTLKYDVGTLSVKDLELVNLLLR